MNNQHPIPQPPELVQQWINEEDGLTAGHIAAQAARWGADQELEACCEWLVRNYNYPKAGNPLRTARRPHTPPSLKEQALARLAELESDEPGYGAGIADIRRALEALPE
jgi:hypothetical protein